MARIQLESGFRNVVQEDYRDHRIEAVAAFDGKADRWWSHAYVIGPKSIRKKVDVTASCDTIHEAVENAFNKAKEFLDELDKPAASAFQNVVKSHLNP